MLIGNISSYIKLLTKDKIMCEYCFYNDTCGICGKDSDEIEIIYELDEYASRRYGEEVGYYYCIDCIQ
jgi:hypothetical protein